MSNDRTIVIGNMMDEIFRKMFEQSRRVYGAKGLAPALHCMGGGNREIKILMIYEY